ncbi:lipopolysaccharide biosynthesis protein [Micromonospora echinofusca]|uniref:lipopolysaccharide biosynthesis protein n=1 Tax=Micromonospora echinofusca TaxID=47858 RepID=UPI0027DAEC7C|nr:polysaccharide biosynthesis C-terminal domain-containing protein [Micromonospora echinofusca]
MASLAPPRPADAGLGGAARHGVTNLLGVAVAAIAGFGLNVVVTRNWSKVDAGLFFTTTSAFMILYAAARLGTGVGSVYFISRYRTLGQPQRIRASVLVALVPVLLVGTVLAAVGWWAAPELVALTSAEPVDGAVPALRAVLLFVPVAALCDFALAACRGFGRMRPLLLIERVGRTGLQLLGVSLAALLGLSAATALPLTWAAPYLPAGLIALIWLARLVRRAERAAAGPTGTPATAGPTGTDRRVGFREEFGVYWRYTGPRALTSLGQMAVQRMDIVLLGTMRGLADAATYTAATRFLALGQLSGQALSTAVQHRLAEHLVRDDRAGAGRLYQAATGWLVLLAWPTYLLFATFAEPVLAIFGAEYLAGRSVTVYLALTMLVATGCGMVDTVLNMAGRTAWTFYNALVGTLVNLVLNLLLIPPYGIMGAAVAWSASILISNLVPLAQLFWAYRLHPFGRGTLTAAGLAVVCYGLPPLLARPVFGDGLPVLAAVALVGTLGYAALVWRFRRALQLDALRTLRRGRRR